MDMMIMMALPELNIELLVMTMLVILLTVQMKIIVLHIMYMETMVRMMQLLLLLSSCSSGLVAANNVNKGQLQVNYEYSATGESCMLVRFHFVVPLVPFQLVLVLLGFHSVVLLLRFQYVVVLLEFHWVVALLHLTLGARAASPSTRWRLYKKSTGITRRLPTLQSHLVSTNHVARKHNALQPSRYKSLM